MLTIKFLQFFGGSKNESHHSEKPININIMKNFIISMILLYSYGNVYSQEISVKELKTEVNNVTVFMEGAQIARKKTVELPQGVTILKFVGLSPFIDAKSVRVKTNGNLTVLSVNHQQNFLDKIDKSKDLIILETKLEKIVSSIKLERTYLEIISEELAFLKENRDIGGSLKEINITTLKDASAFFSTNIKTLKFSEIEHNKNIEDLTKQKNDIENQIRSVAGKKEFPTGEILVKAEAKIASTFSFEISYLVNNANWFPSYDIRAKSVNDPIELIYKANVRQDTKEDWNNVKLRFSSSDPNKNGIAPELKTYFLSYNTLPPVYNQLTGSITGKVYDVSTNEALPGVNVIVEGTRIGAVTDVSGSYSITIPYNAGNLVFSYVGYETQQLPISGKIMNVPLNPDISTLQETVVTGYGTQRKNGALQGRVAGVQVQNDNNIRIRGLSSTAVPSQILEKQTTMDFEIKSPYTVLSDNKSYSVVMEEYNLPADYKYYCIPKIDKDAFLMANIVDWEKYSLLEGELNIFFEDTYVGKGLLDVRYASDTLKISLGRDKNVSVTREKSKDFISKQFIGNKKEEAREWLISVRNNKSQKINMVVMDQVPVSTAEEIEIEVQKTSKGTYNTENGEVKWEFSLDPKEKKDFNLKYSVKYPKYQNLIIE